MAVKVVNLASGGMDSSLVSILLLEKGYVIHPLFVNYGQRACEREWQACCSFHSRISANAPVRMDIPGYGKIIQSGLTSERYDIVQDVFLPNRNLVFLTMASAYAYQVGAEMIAIGLLAERFSLFPDQSEDFLLNAELTISKSLNRQIRVIAPLSQFSKQDVVLMAKEKGVYGTYSCHVGGDLPCMTCIACLEFSR